MLEFYKDRIKKQSVKNFMLHNNRGQFIMQFGRSKEDNVFALDFTGPFSPLAAFGVALVRWLLDCNRSGRSGSAWSKLCATDW